MKRDKKYDILFWCWFAACLLLAFVLVSAVCVGRGCDYAGAVISWLTLTGIPVSGLIWLKQLMNSENGKWYFLLPLCILTAGCTIFLSSLFAAICSICPFDVWQQERIFFWDWFLREYNGDLAETAQRMMRPEVTGEILRNNVSIMMKYHLYAKMGMWSGWIVIGLVSILIFLRRKGKNSGRICCAGMSCGLLLLGIGYFNHAFAQKTGHMLKVFLSLQQECMEGMKKIRPAVPREKIVELIEAHARKTGFGEGHQILLERIGGEK